MGICDYDCFHCIYDDCISDDNIYQFAELDLALDRYVEQKNTNRYIYNKKYLNTEAGKETMRRYNHSEKGRARMRKYNHSEKGKARRKRYENNEKRKAYRREWKRKKRFENKLKKEQELLCQN